MSESNRPQIYYVYDALCGWCYGFGPVIREFSHKYSDEFDFQVLSGGMVTGEQEGSVAEVAGFIGSAYKDVEKATGIKFGERFLTHTLIEGDAYFSSVPAALAMALFRTQHPHQSIEFANRIQRAIYYDGLPPAELETYGICASDFNLDGQLFQQKMEDPAVQELVRQEFQVVARWGIKGFPSVLLQQDQNAWVLTRGYTSLSVLEENLQKIKEEISRKKGKGNL